MRKYWPVLLILLAACFFYLPSLNLGFVSDDYYYTSFRSLKDTLFIIPGLYHYSPVFWLFMYLLKITFGSDPVIFHLVSLIIHLLNIALVYIIAEKLFNNNLAASFSSLTFAFFFSHYEVVYWVTGIDTSLFTLFYLLGLLFYIKFTVARKTVFLNLYSLFAGMALLTHEYAVSLPVTVFLYEGILIRKKRLIKSVYYQLTISLLTAGFFLVKAVFSGVDLVVVPFSVLKFLSSVVKSIDYLILPVPQLLDRMPKALLVLFFAFICFIFLRLIRRPKALFIICWLVMTVFLFSGVSVPQARYYYLSSVPALLIMAYILNIKPRSHFIWLRLGVVMIFLLSGLLFLKMQEGHWFTASQIINNTVNTVRKQKINQSTEFDPLFLNLPDSVNGPPWNVYVFRGGLDKVFYHNGIVFAKIDYGRTQDLNGIIRDDRLYSWEEIDDYLSLGVPVYNYDEVGQSVRRINYEADGDSKSEINQ